MRNRRTPPLVIVLSMALALVPGARPASALSPAEIRARISSLRASLSGVGTRLDQVERRLSDADDAVAAHTRALFLARARRADLTGAINRRAKEMYMFGTEPVLGGFTGTSDLTQYVDRLSFLDLIRRGEEGLLEEVRALQSRSQMESVALDDVLSVQRSIHDELAARQAEMSSKLNELLRLSQFLDSTGARIGPRGSRGEGRGLYCPVAGPTFVNNNFGDPRPGGPHQGDDMRGIIGQPVRAVLPARVIETPDGGWMGIGIIIRDLSGTEWWYAHLSARSVQTGDLLSAGESIGRVGCTGRCYGPHLHFEWHPGGGPARDPYQILSSAC